MTTNAVIHEMFEELKCKLQAMEDKLDSRTEINDQSKEDKEKQGQQNRQSAERILRQIAGHLEAIQREKGSLRADMKDLKARFNLKLDKHREIQHQQYRLKTTRRTTIQSFILLTCFLVGSVLINICQSEKISRMRENDWKYRYIRMNQGISKDQLEKLEQAFSEFH
ncbi:hypothetical protein [Gaoshiqia sediminis]|uniref:Uncharacterized protein n=1 Tax=Gaoshiqia sediminis TaxID=2986998 RepID=A0AA41YB93_9BACT|nr:hypothetical protein [Gaoshiqia sediminis]MCW0484882.1 hypothetical protein [Gaoshiqia sediminis]